MDALQFLRRAPLALRALGALCLSVLVAVGYSQAPQVKPFEPEVGQAGKDVVWVPTPQELVNRMLNLAKVTPRDYVIDLGSGDGRTVITAAKRGASTTTARRGTQHTGSTTAAGRLQPPVNPRSGRAAGDGAFGTSFGINAA